MTVPARNANVVALFPLQEVIFDKDGTGPLAAGVVSFFSDPQFSVPKDVYQETDDPVTGVVQYTNLGSVLILSGIGSFVDGNGSNFIPMLYPYVGMPGDGLPAVFEPYYITVYSSTGVFQFSTNDWPPNSFSQSGTSGTVAPLTPNLITNPQFSVISFTPDPAVGYFTYAVTGTETNPLAPGWSLVTTGTGTVQVEQISLSASIVSEAPYALQLKWSTGLTSLQVVQQLTNSPRIIAGSNGAASVVISSPTGDVNRVDLLYTTPDSVSVTFVSGITVGTNTFVTISGTEPIPTTSTQSASGYVSFIIQVDSTSLSSASELQITSAQLVGVATSTSTANYIQQTTQENLNNLFWYYQPELLFKPIPSYTLGWDFRFNPGQELGPTGGTFSIGANKSTYIADQTIMFQVVNNSISYTLTTTAGLSISTSINGQFALIQYLDQRTAQELLANRMTVGLSAYINGSEGSIIGRVSMYWTTGSLPTITSGTNNSLVATLDATGIPSTFNGTWVPITRGGLGDHPEFQLSSTPQTLMFNNFQPNPTGESTATYFAIVIGFETLDTGSTVVFDYISLCAGDIATRPAPLNEAQTLQGLQYYYQKSYALADLPGATTSYAVAAPMIGMNPGGGGGTSSYVQSFSTQYTLKRAAPTITYYSNATGSSGQISMTTFVGGVAATSADAPVSNWTQEVSTQLTLMVSNASTAYAHNGGTSVPFYSVGAYNYVADARFGVV